MSCKIGFCVDAFYGNWEEIDSKINNEKDAVNWAKSVREQDNVKTRVRKVKYFETIIMDDDKYGFESDIDIIEDEIVWESDKQ